MQYEALRTEIITTQQRNFQVIGAGVLIAPVLHYLPVAAAPLALALPGLALVVMVIHLANDRAILRCADFIREEIEPRLGADERIAGWETWLAREPASRWTADFFTRVGVVSILIIYFLVAFAIATAQVPWDSPVLAVIAAYAVVGSVLMLYLWKTLGRRDWPGKGAAATAGRPVGWVVPIVVTLPRDHAGDRDYEMRVKLTVKGDEARAEVLPDAEAPAEPPPAATVIGAPPETVSEHKLQVAREADPPQAVPVVLPADPASSQPEEPSIVKPTPGT